VPADPEIQRNLIFLVLALEAQSQHAQTFEEKLQTTPNA
jgi:hypothetical protein